MATREQIAVQAHNRRVDQEHDRLLRKLESSREKVLREIRRLEERLLDDPIQASKIRYSENGEVTSEPVTIESESFNLTVQPVSSGELEETTTFDPPAHVAETAKVQPLALMVCTLGTFVAFRIDNYELSYRIALKWVKERSAQESSVCLVDHESGEYYYPIDTDLRGEVIASYPRFGLIAFEPFRRPTQALSVQFSGVKLTSKRGGAETFEFHCRAPSLAGRIDKMLSEGGIVSRAIVEIDRIVQQQRVAVEEQRQRLHRPIPQSGCLVALVAFPCAIASSWLAARISGIVQ